MSPAVALVETRRAVGTPAGVDVVAVFVTVVEARKIGLDGHVVRIAAVLGRRHRRVELVDAVHDARLLAFGVVVFVTVVFVAQQGVDRVVSERAVVSEQLVERVADRAGIGLADHTSLRRCVAVVFVVYDRTLVVVEVGTHVERELQSVEFGVLPGRAERGIGTGRKGVARVVGLVVVELGLRVETLCRGAVGKAVVVLRTVFVLAVAGRVRHVAAGHVLQVDGIDGRHELRRVPDVRGACVGEAQVVRFAVCEVGVHADLEPVLGLRIDVHASRVTVEVGVLKNTVLLVIAQRYEVVRTLRPAVHRDDVLGAYGRFVADLVHPVLVPRGLGVRADPARRLVDQRFPRIVFVGVVILGVFQPADLLAEVVRRIAAGTFEIHARTVLGAVTQRFVAHFDVILHVHQVVTVQCARGDADVTLVRYAYPVVFALLGRDDDHAVGTARSVERTGRCVLEDGHRLDVVRVERAQRAVVRHAVHDVERRGYGIDRPDAAYDDRGAFARLAAARGHLDAGNGTFERFADVAHHALLQLVALDYGGRAGERLLLGRAVGYDHDAFDLGGVFLHCDVDLGAARDLYLGRFVADVGDQERGVGRDVGKRVVSCDVRAGALRSALHDDIGPDDGFAVGSGYHAADGGILRRGRRHAHKRHHAPENCCYLVHTCTLILKSACCE